MNNELYHHGVSGMKWGKRNGPPYPLNAEGKADLRAQKKAARAENKELASQVKKSQVYKNNKMMNQMRAKKRVHRDTAIGGLASAAVGFAAGGPVGAAAGIIGGALVSSIASSTVNKGRQIYENSKFKNMKVSELKEKRAYANEFANLSKKEQQKRMNDSYDEPINGKYPSAKQYKELKKLSRNKNKEYYTKLADYTKNLSDSDRMQYLEDFRPQYISEKNFLRNVKSYETSNSQNKYVNQGIVVPESDKYKELRQKAKDYDSKTPSDKWDEQKSDDLHRAAAIQRNEDMVEYIRQTAKDGRGDAEEERRKKRR